MTRYPAAGRFVLPVVCVMLTAPQVTLAQARRPVLINHAGMQSNNRQVDAPQTNFYGVSESSSDGSRLEVVRERYPDGSIKIERHVAQDDNFNYVNQGPWTMWDEMGNMLGVGEFRQGIRHGRWTRWFSEMSPEGTDIVEMTDGVSFDSFARPFVSRVNFVDGKLDGTWTINDANGKKIVAWEFQNNQLHGTCTWFYPEGKPRRQIGFARGILHGNWLEWTIDEQLIKNEMYVGGRRRAPHTELYSTGERYCEGWYLHPAERTKITIDWWYGLLNVEVIGQQGKDEKHGLWTYWHQNGKKLSEGEFVEGRGVGTHTWWYANGQKQTEGAYAAGAQTGPWTWWYENGQKKTAGEYVNGRQAGMWISWRQDGKVLITRDLSGGEDSSDVATAEVGSKSPATKNAPAGFSTESDDDPVIEVPDDAGAKKSKKPEAKATQKSDSKKLLPHMPEALKRTSENITEKFNSGMKTLLKPLEPHNNEAKGQHASRSVDRAK